MLDVANNSKHEPSMDLLMLLQRHRNYDLNNITVALSSSKILCNIRLNYTFFLYNFLTPI